MKTEKEINEFYEALENHNRIKALLDFTNWTGLSTQELWQAGRLGNDPGEFLMMVADELFPIRKVSDIEKRNSLVAKVIEKLKQSEFTVKHQMRYQK